MSSQITIRFLINELKTLNNVESFLFYPISLSLFPKGRDLFIINITYMDDSFNYIC